jgi:hypothetical protein
MNGLVKSGLINIGEVTPLTWLNKMKDKNQRLLRWALALQTYTFEVKYCKGSQNGNADGLSRFC